MAITEILKFVLEKRKSYVFFLKKREREITLFFPLYSRKTLGERSTGTEAFKIYFREMLLHILSTFEIFLLPLNHVFKKQLLESHGCFYLQLWSLAVITERRNSLYTRRAEFNYCAFSGLFPPPFSCDQGSFVSVNHGVVSILGAPKHHLGMISVRAFVNMVLKIWWLILVLTGLPRTFQKRIKTSLFCEDLKSLEKRLSKWLFSYCLLCKPELVMIEVWLSYHWTWLLWV